MLILLIIADIYWALPMCQSLVLSAIPVLIILIFVRWVLIFQLYTLGSWGTENSGKTSSTTQLANVLYKEHI